MRETDLLYMQRALILAQTAQAAGEVPVGAIIVKEGEIIGEGYNHPIQAHDPSAHAEMVAIRAAAQHAKNYRLTNTTLYVTLEPCLMCVGAILHARIARLVFAASDPKVGAVREQLQTMQQQDATHFNHTLEWEGGVLDAEASNLLKQFFKSRRR